MQTNTQNLILYLYFIGNYSASRIAREVQVDVKTAYTFTAKSKRTGKIFFRNLLILSGVVKADEFYQTAGLKRQKTWERAKEGKKKPGRGTYKSDRFPAVSLLKDVLELSCILRCQETEGSR